MHSILLTVLSHGENSASQLRIKLLAGYVWSAATPTHTDTVINQGKRRDRWRFGRVCQVQLDADIQ